VPRRLLPVLVVVAFAGFAAPAGAQLSEGSQPATCPAVRDSADRPLPEYTLRPLKKPELKTLRACLSDALWTSALTTFFGRYRKEFADWVVYIDAQGEVHQGFSGHQHSDSILVNKKFIWAVVISEKPIVQTRAVEAALDATLRAQLAHAAATAAANGAGGDAALVVDPEAVAAAERALAVLKARRDSSVDAAKAAASKDSVAERRAKLKTASHADTVEWLIAKREAAGAKAAANAASSAVGTAEGAVAAAVLKARVDRLGFDVAAREAKADLAMTAAAARSTMEAADTADLRFARRTVIVQQSPMLTTLIVGLLKPFGASAPAAPSLADSVRTIKLRPIAADPDDPIVAGFARFSLIDNTAVELALTPVYGKEFPDPTKAQAIYGNLANSKQPRFELGVLAGATHGPRVPTYNANLQATSETPKLNINGYVTAIWNWGWIEPLWDTRPNWRDASIGTFLGTNVLTGPIGSQIVTGLTVGHLLSDAGFSFGVAALQEPELRGGYSVSIWKGQLLFGVDLRF
jgi:hypothetical protein